MNANVEAPKFTPGPWMAASAPSSIVGWPVVAPGGRVIATLTYVAHSKIDPKVPGDDAFNRECRANGYLIAAAPDMFLALQELAALVHSNTSGAPWTKFREPYEKAAEALAKARGEA